MPDLDGWDIIFILCFFTGLLTITLLVPSLNYHSFEYWVIGLGSVALVGLSALGFWLKYKNNRKQGKR